MFSRPKLSQCALHIAGLGECLCQSVVHLFDFWIDSKGLLVELDRRRDVADALSFQTLLVVGVGLLLAPGSRSTELGVETAARSTLRPRRLSGSRRGGLPNY
ncbi:MAG: hypothetical protein U0105_24575 [Candidatus Obscuribacterales bacterium]